jgi:glucose-fructose oxidoreductase
VELMAMAASSDDERFREVDEMTSVQLRFPGNRLATFICSFGAADIGHYQIVGAQGDLFMDSAYSYAEKMRYTLTIDGKSTQHKSSRHDQFGPELVYFSNRVLLGSEPEPGGKEGLADVRLIQAMLQSIRTGQPVKLKPVTGMTYPLPHQTIKRPGGRKPKVVHATAPGESK